MFNNIKGKQKLGEIFIIIDIFDRLFIFKIH